MEVKKLKEIFEDKSEEELMAILWRHNHNVEATVGAICNGEDISFDNHKSAPLHVLPATQHQPLSRFTLRNKSCAHPVSSPSQPSLFSVFTRKMQSISYRIRPPQRIKRKCSADQRRRILLDLQREAWEHEKVEFQHVLRTSFSSQEFGSDYVTEGYLSELLRVPTFLTGLENNIYPAEEGNTKMYKHNNVTQTCTRKSKGAPKAKKIPPILREKFKVISDSIEQARMSQVRVPKTNNREDLVEQLEAMERETKEACKRIIEDHLKSYLKEYPDSSYENWIQELHPENFGEKYAVEDNDNKVDQRFYFERSDHRIIWKTIVL